MGITCNSSYKSLLMLAVCKNQGYTIENYKDIYDFYKKLVTLSLYSILKVKKVNYIIQNIKKIL